MHYHIIEISLYEIALNDNIVSLRYGMYPFARLNMLYACLNSIRRCFDAAYELPLSKWFDLPYTIWALLGHTILALSKMTFLNADGWEQDYVRSIVDFPVMIDTLARKLDEAKATADNSSPETGHSPFARDVLQLHSTLSSNLQQFKLVHNKYSAQMDRPTQNPVASSADTFVIHPEDEFNVLPQAQFFEFLDYDFWNQFV